MPLLSRKGILAIAAVIDVALNSRNRPVSAKALATRHGLPPRHLEPVLQALVHDGILRGVRGPRGGYELGREQKQITAVDILRAAGTADEDSEMDFPTSSQIQTVVLPALAQAERAFAAALGNQHRRVGDQRRPSSTLTRSGIARWRCSRSGLLRADSAWS